METPPLDPIDLVAFVGLPKEIFGAITARNAFKVAAIKALPKMAINSAGRMTSINLTHPKTVQAAARALGKYNKAFGQAAGGVTTNIMDAVGDDVDYSK